MAEFYYSDNVSDIHGREIPTTPGPDGKVLCALSDLKQTGVQLFQKSQCEQLSTIQYNESDFGAGFNEHMIRAAMDFMLANKIHFTDKIIMNSIESCKTSLKTSRKQKTNVVTPKKKLFITNMPAKQGDLETNILLKDRQIQKGDDTDIIIKFPNTPPSSSRKTPSPKPPRVVQSHPPSFSQKTPSPKPPHVAQSHPPSFSQKAPSPKPSHVAQSHQPKTLPQKGFSLNKTDEEKRTNGEKKQASWGEMTSPQSQSLPSNPKFGTNVEQVEVAAVVTAIDKPNCIWVRDVANQGLFEQIFTKTNEEAKFQKAAQKPWVMDRVYMAKEASWFRCKVVRYCPLSVFFVDYGTVAEVDELKDVSSELASAPCVAVRITFKTKEYIPRLKDQIRIKIIHKNDDGTYYVNILSGAQIGKSPLSTKPLVREMQNLSLNSEDGLSPARKPPVKSSEKSNFTPKRDEPPQFLAKEMQNLSLNSEDGPSPARKPPVKSSEKSNFTPKKDESPQVFKMPPFLCQVQESQRVAIVALVNDRFYLRTKQCYEKLREIENAVEKYAKNAPSLSEVQAKQLVLFKKKSDGLFYRATVTMVQKNCIAVELLDYVEHHVTESLASFKAINEQLSREPVAYFSGGKLVEYENKELSQQARDAVAELIREKKKFTVTLGFDNELDLYDGTQLLSQKLQDLKKETKRISLIDTKPSKPKRISLTDIKPYQPEFGVQSYVCGCYKSSKELTIVPSEELQKHVDYLIRSEVDDDKVYEPQTGEVCLCLHEEDWYRGAVLEICDTTYKMFLLDFGNIEFVKKEMVRKPDEKVGEIPTLALPCVLTGVPHHNNVENLLKQKIIEGEVYHMDVKKFGGGKYHVEVPRIYKNINDML